MKSSRVLTMLLAAAALCLSAPVSAGEPVGWGYVERSAAPCPHVDRPFPAVGAAPRTSRAVAGEYPMLAWPLELGLNEGVGIAMYVDLDETVGGLLDYMGGEWTYDGHGGTDFSVMGFRAMDRGVRILAAADGVVRSPWEDSYPSVVYDLFDRNTASNMGTKNNRVIVEHADSTFTFYVHLRTNSATVVPGDSVKAGQVVGLLGSSGISTGPHLHFEVSSLGEGGWIRRDPFHGPSQPEPSLWIDQPPYADETNFNVFDGGVFTEAAFGGSMSPMPGRLLEDGFVPSVGVFGSGEQYIACWFSLQGTEGDAYTVEFRRADGVVYVEADGALATTHSNAMYYYYFTTGGITPDLYGTWTFSIIADDATVFSRAFEVGAGTIYRPQFYPIAGRSLRAKAEPVRDTLRASDLSGPVTYALLNAPASVTIEQDSIVTLAATHTQAYRSSYFQVTATGQAGLQDTMWYHVVDTTRSVSPELGMQSVLGGEVVSVWRDEAARPAATMLLPNVPNPFNPTTVVRFVLPEPGEVSLAVYDVLGRRVRVLSEGHRSAGTHAVAWDGRDGRGASVASGVYLARLTTWQGTSVRRMLLVR